MPIWRGTWAGWLHKELAVLDFHGMDVRCDCAGVARGRTKGAVLQQAAAHAVNRNGALVTPAPATTAMVVIHDCQGSGAQDLPG
jgi:hypothetical protein